MFRWLAGMFLSPLLHTDASQFCGMAMFNTHGNVPKGPFAITTNLHSRIAWGGLHSVVDSHTLHVAGRWKYDLMWQMLLFQLSSGVCVFFPPLTITTANTANSWWRSSISNEFRTLEWCIYVQHYIMTQRIASWSFFSTTQKTALNVSRTPEFKIHTI